MCKKVDGKNYLKFCNKMQLIFNSRIATVEKYLNEWIILK
jgi:hypothetical protein